MVTGLTRTRLGFLFLFVKYLLSFLISVVLILILVPEFIFITIRDQTNLGLLFAQQTQTGGAGGSWAT